MSPPQTLATILFLLLSVVGARAQGDPTAIVICGVLNNAQVTAEQCYGAMMQAFGNRVAAYNNQYGSYLNQLSAERAGLFQECSVLHNFAGQIGYDVRSLPPC